MIVKSEKKRYTRIAKIPITAVLPFVFTKETRRRLRSMGYSYNSPEWKKASQHVFFVRINGKTQPITVPMGSHRYQLFVAKGTTCVCCGTEGLYFALECNTVGNPSKFHLNLYGRDECGKEIMMTKDHIVPRSKGGENRLSNYQPMCYRCNQKKADKIENDRGKDKKKRRFNNVFVPGM